jgi:hypothetical protein
MALQIGAGNNQERLRYLYIIYGLPQAPNTAEDILEIDAEIVNNRLISERLHKTSK